MDGEIFKERLLLERARLEREITDLEAGLLESLEDSSEESPYDQHLAETAGITLDREIDLTLEENLQSTIAQIDRALGKIAQGTYGRCDECGGLIPDARLEAAPFATLCVDCKRLEERNL